MAVTPEGFAANSYSGSRSPSVTFGVSPVEDDVIIFAVGSTGVAALTGGDEPADWVNCLNDNQVVDPGDGSVLEVILYHIVTAAEDAANTVTFTLTNLWAVTEIGDVVAEYFRGVDTAAVIDAFNSGSDAGNPATHVLPAITGTDIDVANGLCVRGVFSDGLTTYTTPGSHTVLGTSNTNHAAWMGTHNTLASIDTDIAATDITPGAANEYASWSIVLTPLAVGGGDGVVITRQVVI